MNNRIGAPRQISSLLKQSLLLKVYTAIVAEKKGDKNTWFAGIHFRNNPREHPGERHLHFIENADIPKIINEIKKENPDLIYKTGSLTKKKKVIAA